MLLLLSPVGESSSITKWFWLYYKPPAIRLFIQPDFVLGCPGSLCPSVVMHGVRCMQVGGADTRQPLSPLTPGCGGQATKPQSAFASA